jgi:hypothetical protein
VGRNAERVVGDFNGDGRDDIALIGNSAWQYGRGAGTELTSRLFQARLSSHTLNGGDSIEWNLRRHKAFRACTHKIAIGDIALINVRFGPLCGLKSDISPGPRSAN